MSETISRYPLQWPVGWKRTKYPITAAFGKKTSGSFGTAKLTVYDGVGRVLDELRRMGVSEADVVVSTNLKTRLDGLPLSNQTEPGDSGAAVYWRRNKEMKVIAIDNYLRVADNLAAIAATLDAMRAIERHGGATILDRAFTGFDALPAPGAARTWREILGVAPDVTNIDVARAMYRMRASEHHPDKGGSAEKMAEINQAWADARAALS